MLFALILLAVCILVEAWVQRTAVLDLRDGLAESLSDVGNVLGTQAARSDSSEVAELKRELAVLRRELTDVDEKAEQRFRRLAARNRRDSEALKHSTADDDEDEVDPMEMFDPRQLALPGFPQANGMEHAHTPQLVPPPPSYRRR